MPRVVITTGFTTEDGAEEVLSEFQCDVPGCPNAAVTVIGFVREVGAGFAACAEHTARNRTEPSLDRE